MVLFFSKREFGVLVLASVSALAPGLLCRTASAAREHEQRFWQQQGSPSQQGSQTSQSAQTQGSAQTDPSPTASQTKDADEIGALPIKRRKVWTNDEVVGLRSPADSYRVQKEAQAAAEQRAAVQAATEVKLAKEDAAAKQADRAVKLPTTLAETQKLVKDKEDQVNDEQAALERLIKEMPDAPEDQKPVMQKEIDRLTADVPRVRRELQLFQDYLEKLIRAQLNEAPAAPPPPQ